MVRIGQQIDRERELVTKILVRIDIIFADADNRDIRFVKFLFGRRERLALNRTTGRIVFWVDVNDQPLAYKVTGCNHLSVLIQQTEFRKLLSNFCCHFRFSFLSMSSPDLSLSCQTTIADRRVCDYGDGRSLLNFFRFIQASLIVCVAASVSASESGKVSVPAAARACRPS